MKISIIIPNYNGEELLKKNLSKVFDAAAHYMKESNNEVEVIVIDDASTDNSLEEIQNEKIKSQNYKLKFKNLINDKNLGFSPTANKGVRESSGEVMVLLNTDVLPEKKFLIPLLDHFKDENIFAVGCMDKSIEGGKEVLRGRGLGEWKRGFLIHSKGEVDKKNTLWVNGGSGAFRKSIWNRLNGFNELYSPFYWEDIDISYRALKAGYGVVFEPRSIVVHEHEKGAIVQKYSKLQIKTIAYRNQFIFVWINATDIDLKITHIMWLPYHLLKAIIRGDTAFFLGFFHALIRLPKIIQSKLKAKGHILKSDAEVVKEFSK